MRQLWLSIAGTAIALTLLGTASSCSEDAPATDTGASPDRSASASAAGADTATQADTLIQTGISQAQAGDLTSAEVTFNNALVLDPGNKFALFNLGVIAQGKGDAAAATGFYDQALASDPAYTPALYNKAILLEASDLPGAVDLYEKILTIDKKASTTYLRLSFAYDKLGEPGRAQAAREKAVQLDPSLASVTGAPAA